MCRPGRLGQRQLAIERGQKKSEDGAGGRGEGAQGWGKGTMDSRDVLGGEEVGVEPEAAEGRKTCIGRVVGGSDICSGVGVGVVWEVSG